MDLASHPQSSSSCHLSTALPWNSTIRPASHGSPLQDRHPHHPHRTKNAERRSASTTQNPRARQKKRKKHLLSSSQKKTKITSGPQSRRLVRPRRHHPRQKRQHQRKRRLAAAVLFRPELATDLAPRPDATAAAFAAVVPAATARRGARGGISGRCRDRRFRPMLGEAVTRCGQSSRGTCFIVRVAAFSGIAGEAREESAAAAARGVVPGVVRDVGAEGDDELLEGAAAVLGIEGGVIAATMYVAVGGSGERRWRCRD